MSKKRWTVFLLALLVMALGVGYLAYYFTSRSRQQSVYEEVLEISGAAKIDHEKREIERADWSDGEKAAYSSPIDFEALWAINEDIYAWIEIVNADVSYPIAQSATDDSYYLNHTIEGAEGLPGSIYTSNVNAKDFSDFNTVIYGHRMGGNWMFGGLSSYRDMDFFSAHRTIKIYLPDRELTYRVFAAVVYDDRLITWYFNNDDPASCRDYLDSLYANRDLGSNVLDDVSVSEDDRVITLSTCVKGRPKNRYLVVAVLSDEIS